MNIEFEIRKIVNSKCHNAGSCNDCHQIAEEIIELLEREKEATYYGH